MNFIIKKVDKEHIIYNVDYEETIIGYLDSSYENNLQTNTVYMDFDNHFEEYYRILNPNNPQKNKKYFKIKK